MSYEIKKIWHACCDQLKTILSNDIYDRWIAVIQPLSIQENTLQLAVANDFYKDWLEENYLPLIEKALTLTGYEELTASLTVDIQSFENSTSNEESAVEVPKKERAIRVSNKSKNNLNPAYTFDSFVIGENNQFAHAAAMAAATHPHEPIIHFSFMVALVWEKRI